MKRVHVGKTKLIIVSIPSHFLSSSEEGALVLTNALLLVGLTSEGKERNFKLLQVDLINNSVSPCFILSLQCFYNNNYSKRKKNGFKYGHGSVCTCRLVLGFVFHYRSCCNRRLVGWSGGQRSCDRFHYTWQTWQRHRLRCK